MGYNWTIEVVINLLGSLPYFVSVWLLNTHYRRHKDKIILALMITWGTYGLYWFSNGLAYLFLDIDIFRINKILLLMSTVAMIFGFDMMMRERINPYELSFVVLLNGLILYIVSDSKSIIIEELANGDQTVAHGSAARNVIFILGVFMSIIYLYYTMKIYQFSTPEYQKYARLLIIGAVIFGPLATISFMLRFGTYIPGISALISSIGVLLTTLAIQKSPQLIYILKAQVVKLSVIDQNSGLTLFTYDWNRELIDVEASLIASVLESISIFTQEVLQKGGLKEILLEDSVIYIDRAAQYNCHFILISNNRSEVLKRNLRVFGDLFIEKYRKLLDTMQKPMIETTEFEVANELIPLAFPYIPGN